MKILYFDTETTGLNPTVNDVIQVAGIIEIDGEVKEQFNISCQPFDYANISPQALAVNGHTIESLKALQTPQSAYKQITKIFSKYINKFDKEDKFVPMGQNIKFDIDFMQQFFVKNNDKYFGSFVGRHTIDLMTLSAFFTDAGLINPPNFKLETVANHMGIEFGAHDALEDIMATRAVFKKFQRYVVSPEEAKS